MHSRTRYEEISYILKRLNSRDVTVTNKNAKMSPDEIKFFINCNGFISSIVYVCHENDTYDVVEGCDVLNGVVEFLKSDDIPFRWKNKLQSMVIPCIELTSEDYEIYKSLKKN